MVTTSIDIPNSGEIPLGGTKKNNDLVRARRLLYLSHLFAKGSDVAWQFCLTLFLAAFTNYKNLILVSTYGIFSGIVTCLMGGRIGKLIDDKPRLFLARVFIWTQNSCVLLSTMFCYLLLDISNGSFEQEESTSWIWSRLNGVPTSPYAISLLVGIHIFGAMANILDESFTVAIEKDWIVVMNEFSCRNNPHDDATDCSKWLSETNVAMTQIDLSCKSLGPAAAGIFIAAFGDPSDEGYSNSGLDGAVLLIGALNISCLVVEWFCTARIYQLIPDLSKKSFKYNEINIERTSSVEQKVINDLDAQENPNEKQFLFSFPSDWKIYLNQSVSWGGISLALLYLNILSFGAIMTAYLVWRGMSLKSIGIWRGFSAVVGLLGTFAFRFSVSKISIELTGMWSISFQFFCLTICYVSLFFQSFTHSLVMLIGGVCASRVGLWVFDISIRQLMQQYVCEDVRGVVGGIQQSLQSFFFIFTFALGILFPDPRQFHILVASGYASVGIALLCYFFGLYLRRHTLT